ncbi:hypothetical protein GCG21_00710 [Pseudactinotalea sp. HY160]|uniref:hypothetical protein n=1 Tax=Pseudactinotalea sp. HY160 TaxID=2654490 RepID=UPI00128B4BAE|nr:hypothetical protein [Pseudactinotalea sp. HY160]MPV48554.1 hypothetical protein [Pseudactinotalea sp. HY160]
MSNEIARNDAEGGAILRVVALEPGGVDAMRCDAASGLAGVIGAGGVLHSDRVGIEGYGHESTSLVIVTPGLLRIAWREVVVRGAVASRLLSEQYGWNSGSLISLRHDSGRIDDIPLTGVAISSARVPALVSGVATPAPPTGGDRVRECLVESSYGSRRSVEEELLWWFGRSENVIVTPLIADSTDSREIMEGYRTTTGITWVPSIAAGLYGVLLVCELLVRRRDFAVYRALGVGRAGMATLVVTERLPALAVVTGGASSLALMTTATWSRLALDAVTLEIVQVVAVLVAGVVVQAVLAGSISIQRAMKSA